MSTSFAALAMRILSRGPSAPSKYLSYICTVTALVPRSGAYSIFVLSTIPPPRIWGMQFRWLVDTINGGQPFISPKLLRSCARCYTCDCSNVIFYVPWRSQTGLHHQIPSLKVKRPALTQVGRILVNRISKLSDFGLC